MNLAEAIIAAEQKYIGKLEEYLKELFSGVFLPSHGIEHHKRVWKYAKELYIADNKVFTVPANERAVEKLIIACYLHDAGMYADRSERHGVVSRKLCEEFLKSNNLPMKEFDDILDAVETHTEKDNLPSGEQNRLKIILNIADDLDAFGYTGIYRYIEIYTERGIALNDMGIRILKNVKIRFNNFSLWYRKSSIYSHHSARYRQVKNFCVHYIKESESYIFGTETPGSYCGVAELIGELTRRKLPLSEVWTLSGGIAEKDPVINFYFRKFEKEQAEISKK